MLTPCTCPALASHLPCTCLALVCTCSHLSSICLHLFALAHTIPTSRGRCPLRGMPTAVRKYGVRFYGPWRVLVSDETLERVMFCGQAGEIVIDGMFLVAFHGTLSTRTIPLGRALSSFFYVAFSSRGTFLPCFPVFIAVFGLPVTLSGHLSRFFHCFSSHSLTPRIIGPRPQLHCPLPRAPRHAHPGFSIPTKQGKTRKNKTRQLGSERNKAKR